MVVVLQVETYSMFSSTNNYVKFYVVIECFSPDFYVYKCTVCNSSYKSDVWLTVHRNSVWIRKTN